MSRLLFVHAHPDDETLTCGITMAHHVALGDEVHVLTCTLGEEGEVVPPELAHLQGAEGDPLGPFRLGEVREAMRRLGVHHAVLGAGRGRRTAVPLPGHRHGGYALGRAPSRVRRSGRRGGRLPGRGPHPRPASGRRRHLRPDRWATSTRTTCRPTGSRWPRCGSSRQGERPAYTFHVHTPRSWVRPDRRWLREHVPPDLGLAYPADDEPEISSTVADDLVTHVVVDPVHLPAQVDALDAHRTQLRVWPGGYYALTNDVAARLAGREAFVRVDPLTGERIGTGVVASGLLPPG